MCSTIIMMQRARAEIGRLHDLGGEVGFSDPGTLLMRENDRDDMAGILEGFDQGMYVR